jgi:hypothetical protein
MGTLREDVCACMIIFRRIFLRVRNAKEKKLVEKIKTNILCSVLFSLKSCRLWDNVEKYGTARQAPDVNVIRRMRFAWWVNNAKDTHS